MEQCNKYICHNNYLLYFTLTSRLFRVKFGNSRNCGFAQFRNCQLAQSGILEIGDFASSEIDKSHNRKFKKLRI